MTALRKLYRYLLIALLIIIGIPLSIIFLRNTVPPHGFSSALITTWLHLVTRCLGLKIKTYGTALSKKTLFVSNHLSWLDVLVLGSLIPTHFLSKNEVKSIPILGWFATRSGTLYIKRGNKQSASEARNHITTALNQQHNSLIFAEGTTTDGTIKKFHSRLMQSAIDAQAMVQPIAIFYPVTDEISHKIENNSATFYVGDMTLLASVNLALQEKNIDVIVHYLEPLNSAGKTRDEISQYAYNEVKKALTLIKNYNS